MEEAALCERLQKAWPLFDAGKLEESRESYKARKKRLPFRGKTLWNGRRFIRLIPLCGRWWP